jgi:tripartite-type tricarboxylate transporter receptor subunit TctC
VAARSLWTLLAWFGRPGLVLAGCLASSATTSVAQAPTYPDRPVRLLVPLAAASAVDVVARLVSEKMSDSLGQRFYVENQPGAAGLLGMRAGARAAPDGYTVVVANDSVITMLPNMKADAGYDPLKDFLPVTQLVGIDRAPDAAGCERERAHHACTSEAGRHQLCVRGHR